MELMQFKYHSDKDYPEIGVFANLSSVYNLFGDTRSARDWLLSNWLMIKNCVQVYYNKLNLDVSSMLCAIFSDEVI